MKIRQATVEEMLEQTVRGLSIESLRELIEKDIEYDLFLAPVVVKGKKDFYELYVDVKESRGRRKHRAVLLAYRKGPRQFRLQAALNTIERELPAAKDVRVLTSKEAKKVMADKRPQAKKK